MKTHILRVLCLCICLCACLYPALAQEESSAAQKNISSIEIKGNTSVSTNTIIAKLKMRVGGPYHENIISDDLKRLYQLNYFSDIKIDTENQPGGVKVIITVTERPVVEKVTFTGTKKLRIREHKPSEKTANPVFKIADQELRTFRGAYLDYPSLAEDAENIRKAYERKGFSQAQVEHSVDVDEKTNRAKVTFKIIEGKKKKIKIIYIEGNLHYSDRRILRLLKTKRAWLFNPGVLKEDVFSEDIERVKSFYHNEGYIDAAVESQTRTDPAGRFWYLTLTITEGTRYYVGAVSVEGTRDLSEKDVLAKVTRCAPGNVYSEQRLSDDVSDIQGLYFDKGYISAVVDPSTALNPENGKVDIALSVQENEIAYVNKINIRGNIKTRDTVIRRELRIKPGERFDGDKLRRSKERLQNLGFFEEVSYDTRDTDVSNKKDLIVDVKESKTGAFSFGGGYSSVDHLVGFLEVQQKNFDWKNFPYFTGAGQDLKLRASFGSYSQGYDLSFTNPWVFDYPVTFGFDLYKRSHERESDVGYGYDEDVTGGDLRLGRELNEYLRADMTYRYDVIKISNVSSDATADLKAEEGENTISSMEYGMTYDTRDSVFDPTRGNTLSGSLQVAGGPFGGDKEFWKFFGTASHFQSGMGKGVFELRGRIGLADTYDTTERVPIYERYFAGGAYTVRGYRERKVGPVDSSSGDPLGGESMLIGNIEYLYPFAKFIKGALFYDIGNVWPRMSDVASGDYKAGFGLGVRLKTPIGPIMLDYGIPLDKEPGQDEVGDGRFHFSMSHGF